MSRAADPTGSLALHRPFLLPLLVLLVLALLGAAPVAARPELIASDASGTALRFEIPEPVVTETGHGARVEIDGYPTLAGAPGAPALPGRTVLVAIPAGASVTHQAQVETRATLPGVRPMPVPTPRRPAQGSLPEATFVEDAASYARPSPQGHVDVSEVQRLRDLDVVAVTVRPAIFDPELGGLRVARAIRVEISAAGGRLAAAPAIAALAPADRRFYASAVINPEQVPSFRATTERSAEARPGSGAAPDFGSAPTWIKLFVGGRSMTRLTGAELEAAGVAITAIDPTTLRIFWGGGLEPDPGLSARSSAAPPFMRECAIQVSDAGTPGVLDPGDAIVFLGQGATGWLDDFTGLGYTLEHREHPSVDEGVYWLAWGGGFDTPPLRITTVPAAPQAGAPAVAGGRVRIHFERNARYVADLFEVGQTWEKWWYSTTLRDSDPPVDIPVSADGVVGSEPGELRARIWGFTAMGTANVRDHYLRATWNEAPIFAEAGRDTFEWDGPDFANSGRLDIEGTFTFEAQNTLRLETLEVFDPLRPDRVDESLLAWYQVSYTRELDLSALPALEFASPEGPAGTVNYEIAGVAAQAAVFDVTDPYGPVRIDGERQGTVLRFAGDIDAAQVRKYWVGVPSAYQQVARIEIDDSYPNLRDPENRARYVVIAHDSMIEAASRLAAAHPSLPGEATAAMPMAVRVSDVYDEFAWGLKSATAIRNFIDYAAYAWAPEGRPLYVCLLGDASYDPRDIFGGGTHLTDLVPTQAFWNFIGGSFGGSDYLSDDFFVLTFGEDPETPPDNFTDLLIGRLPARTVEEARILVDEKTLPFIEEPAPGPWRQRILLSADDDRAGEGRVEGFIHVDNSEEVQAELPPELEPVKVYLHDYPRDANNAKPEARAAFIDAFSRGTSLVNYIGHGAPDILAHEALFRIENTGQLTNGTRLPLFFTFSCTVNRFDVPGFEGIGESLVKHRGGGAITSTGATDLSFIGFNQSLNVYTFEALYEDGDHTRPRSMGEALSIAKNRLVTTNVNNARKYVLLGDPAVVPAAPRLRIQLEARTSGGVAAGDTLIAGIPYLLTGTVLGSDGTPTTAAGNALIRVGDSDEIHFRRPPLTPGFVVRAADVFRSTLPGASGVIETAFVVPIDASQSLTTTRALGEMRVYLEGTTDALGVQPVFLNVVDAPQTEPPPAAGPTIEASFDSDPSSVLPGAVLRLRVSDPSGINIVGNTPVNGLFVRFDEEVTVSMNELFEYEPGSATSGTIDLPLPELAPGSHVARIFASDNYLNRSQASLEFSIVELGALELRDAALFPNPFRPTAGRGTILGFQLPEPAVVGVRILTVSGRLVREFFPELDGPLLPGWHQVLWDGRDEDGDFVANGVYLVKVSARSELTGEQVDTLLRSVVSR